MGQPMIVDSSLGLPLPSLEAAPSVACRASSLRSLPALFHSIQASPVHVSNSLKLVESTDVELPKTRRFRGASSMSVSSSSSSSVHATVGKASRRPPKAKKSASPGEESFDYEEAAATLETIFNESPSLELNSGNTVSLTPSRHQEHPIVVRSTDPDGQVEVPEADDNGAKRSSRLSSRSVARKSVRLPSRVRNTIKSTVKGIRRLDLNSRITLRRMRLAELRSSSSKSSAEDWNSKLEDLDIWSPEVEQLIGEYAGTHNLMMQDWDKLSRALLTADEECWLATAMKPMKRLQRIRQRLTEALAREPLEKEWAKASNMDLRTLRRTISLGMAARNKLIQRNLRLVLFQASKYHREGMGLSVFDLCQEGVKGLMHSVGKFDPSRGFRLSTYAIYWIRNDIIRAQTRSGHLVRIPFNVAALKLNIKKMALELCLEFGRAPSHDEICKRMGLDKERYFAVLRTGRRTQSINSRDKVTGREFVENISELEDTSIASSAKKPLLLRVGMDDVLDSLKPKESLVLRQRFGLDGKGERSLGEVSRNMKMSRETARRYEARGLLKLQHPARVAYLRTFLS